MRPRRNPGKHLVQAELSLLPLIDVALVLLIVVLVIGPMLRAGAAAPPRQEPFPGVLALEEPQLAVAIEADGSLHVDGEPVAREKLYERLVEIWSFTPNRSVIVQGDRRLRYDQVRWVLQTVNAAGFRRASLVAGEPPAP